MVWKICGFECIATKAIILSFGLRQHTVHNYDVYGNKIHWYFGLMLAEKKIECAAIANIHMKTIYIQQQYDLMLRKKILLKKNWNKIDNNRVIGCEREENKNKKRKQKKIANFRNTENATHTERTWDSG